MQVSNVLSMEIIIRKYYMQTVITLMEKIKQDNSDICKPKSIRDSHNKLFLSRMYNSIGQPSLWFASTFLCLFLHFWILSSCQYHLWRLPFPHNIHFVLLILIASLIIFKFIPMYLSETESMVVVWVRGL